VLVGTAAPASARTPVELGAAINDHGFLYAGSLYRDTFTRNYDAATAESAFKIEQLQPQRGRYDFALADQMLGWVEQTGKRMHGHTLVWCDDTWLPSWLKDGTWSRDELLAVMEEHIRTVVGRYRGRVPTWDVVTRRSTPTARCATASGPG
jgi:GH35 family endo-1,4-beta-xylanase